MEEISELKPKQTGRRVMLPILGVLIAMAAVSFFAIYNLEKAEAYARYVGIKNVSAERVAKIIRGAEMNANNIFDDVSKNLHSAEDVVTALKRKVNLNLDVRGYFAAFEPDYFPEKGTWFEPYIYQPEYGGFEFRQVGSARHNYTKSPWYVEAKEGNRSFWSEPYYYYDGTSLSGYYCTFVKPIYDDKGDLACVCGADMKFEWLAKELEWVDEVSKNNKIINKYQPITNFDYYTVIFNNDGTCLVNMDDKKLSITDKDILKDFAQRKSGVVDMNIDGKPCTLYYGPIEFIDWMVAVVVPKLDILKPLLPIAIILISLVAIGMIIVWVICKKL